MGERERGIDNRGLINVEETDGTFDYKKLYGKLWPKKKKKNTYIYCSLYSIIFKFCNLVFASSKRNINILLFFFF